MFSPVEWQAGHGPKKEEGNKFVVGVHFAVFDFDDLHETRLPRVTGPLEAAGVAYVITSTWSQSANGATSPTSWASMPKSADNTDGAIRRAPAGPASRRCASFGLSMPRATPISRTAPSTGFGGIHRSTARVPRAPQ